MIKLSKVVLAGAATCFLSLNAFADDHNDKPSNFFADCGIGGAIFKNDVGGTISNIIWDLGLTATTSYVSSPETCEGDEVSAAEFIHQTYANLIEESAAGEGKHLATLMNHYGCQGQEQSAAVGSVRSGLSDILDQSSYDSSSDLEKSADFYGLVKASTQACSA